MSTLANKLEKLSKLGRVALAQIEYKIDELENWFCTLYIHKTTIVIKHDGFTEYPEQAVDLIIEEVCRIGNLMKEIN